MDPGETATASGYASWSWTVCLFISGIFFGLLISGKLLNWKSLLRSMVKALLGYLDSDSDHPPGESTSTMIEGSSSTPRGYKYDVYLSFWDADTRRNFIDYLEHRLWEEGISTIRSTEYSDTGGSFHNLQAINYSRVSIVVFSRGYASSASCLHELVDIVDCHKDMKVLLPIFYDVDPYEVRNQSGAYKDAFDPDKIYKWNAAMMYMANLSGFNLTDKAKGEGIERIVQEVSNLLAYKFQKTRSIDKNPDSIGRRLSLQEVNKYGVFLSFRHTQTSYTFAYYLYHYLTKKGFSTFKSDEETQRGESIPSQVLQAIKDSRVLIVVFTRDYADSTSSLEEVATIVECHREFKQFIIPVFFDVDRKDVQTQTGPYQKNFDSYTEEFEKNPLKVQRWRAALQHMTTLHGVRLKHEYDSEIRVIEKIIQRVERLCSKISGLSSHNQVGIQSSLNVLEGLLKLKDDCVRVLGIWGMCGSGKTTSALALYDRIFQQFEAACFIEEVSKVYRDRSDGGATAVHKQILLETLNKELSDVYSPFEISGLVRKKLSGKQLLIVFDNVDELMHLKELAINPIMLGMGSRIIITTRNRQILDAYGVDVIYQIPLLNKDEALELFISICPSDFNKGCIRLIPRELEYVDGLPLAIKVMPSVLRDCQYASGSEPYFEILRSLQTSLKGLDEEEKEIFLHIACFFHGKRRDYVIEVLNSCGFFAEIGIQALLDKSLITIQNEEIHMHNLLQDLGKKIVRDEDLEFPVERSRLWLRKDFSTVMNSVPGRGNLKAIVLYEDTSTSKHEYLDFQRLSNLKNLELLILCYHHFSGSLPTLPHRLRYLWWHRYPFTSLPLFAPYNRLVQLTLPNSRIERLWNGCKNFPRLEKVDLSCSEKLVETPNFEGSPRLKHLDLTGCTNLKRVHPSIGLLKELSYLSFRNCNKLVTLNLDHECKLSSLRVLDLYGCTNLKNTPDFTGLPNLEDVDLGECTSLSTVHHSIGTLVKLKFLNVEGCINLVQLPDVINVTSLHAPDVPVTKKKYNHLFTRGWWFSR